MTRIKKERIPRFQPGQLEAIAAILGDTSDGLTGSEIRHCLAQAGVEDTDPTLTKRHRLYNALARQHNNDGHGSATLQVIRYAMEPARYTRNSETFEERRAALNVPLAFVGLQLGEDGRFHRVSRANTLSEAERRASRLRKMLTNRDVHQDVLVFCRAELLQDNYFHAVLEVS